MLSTTKSSVIKALFLSTALIITPVHATATAGKIATNVGKLGKLGRGGWVGVGIQLGLMGAGWIIEEGQKDVRRTTTPDEAQETDETANTTTNELAQNAQYPFEYIIDNQSFATAEAAHQYVLTTLLNKQGLARSRQHDGLYYDKLDLYYGNHYNGSPYSEIKSSVGFFRSHVQADSKTNIDDKRPSGRIYTFTGNIYKKGTLSEQDIHLSDDYKAQREAAAKEIARQIEATSTDADASDIDKIIKELQKAKEAKEAKDKTDEKTKEKEQEKIKAKEQEQIDFCTFAKFICDDGLDKDTEIDIQDTDIVTIDTNIRFGGQCPSDVVITGSMFGQTLSFTFFEWHKFCYFLELIKPIIIAMAGYQAVKIVGGVNVAD